MEVLLRWYSKNEARINGGRHRRRGDIGAVESEGDAVRSSGVVLKKRARGRRRLDLVGDLKL